MKQIVGSSFLSSIRRATRAGLAAVLLLASGCAVSPPMVDPYSTLLPPGKAVANSTAPFSAASLKNETAYLVVGANFVTYADIWSKFQKQAEGWAGLGYSRQFMLDAQAQWAPTKVTSLVVADLQKHFKKVVVVNDLAEAQDAKAKWIVMFDHAYVQVSTATSTWTNTSTIDLLDSKFRRVVGAKFSEHKDYGGAFFPGDAQRFMTYRGEDLLRCVKTTLTEFNVKLAAST